HSAELGARSPSGWHGPLPDAAREVEISVAGSAVFGLLYDDPEDPVRGFDTLLLSINKDVSGAVRLKPRPPGDPGSFGSITVSLAGLEVPVFFRLFALSADGSDLLLYRARAGAFLSNRTLVPAAALKATGGFVGNAADDLYLQGALGKILPEGGDGTAERRYLDTVRLVERQFERLLAFGAARTRWDVLVGYIPFPDEFLHLWWGHLDPSLPGHDPVLASRLRPFLDEGLRVADAYVGALVEHADAETVVAVGADHGMSAVRTRVRMNAALVAAGLLGLDAAGHVDLTHTRAYYLAEAGYFLVNRTSRPGGIVAPADEEAVRAAVATVLRGLRDPRTGAAVVEEIIDPRQSDWGLGGPNGGDVYFRLAPGVFPVGDLQGQVVYDAPAAGEHLLDPRRPDVQASFVVAGPGVARGADLGVIRQIDIAPTLAVLLGLDPPAQATGTVLEKALASPTRPR
ncbi:MAG TPA: alkaline phosphatase family protein, partial [Vicinamibacteria bacterium]|nr:alkaline phosphatase family protein [Vicinamibacteria bacterium]